MTHFKTAVLTAFVVFVFAFIPFLNAENPSVDSQPEILRYQQLEGEVLHAESLVKESVYINGLYSHDASIGETSVSIIREIRDDGHAVLDSSFRTEERIDGRPDYLEWVSSEEVRLSRDARGRMDVPENAARPVIRNIPVFPEYPVSPGDSWTAMAEEVHLFRIGGRQAGPYRGEIPVSYEYLEDLRDDGSRLARIRISYNIYLPVRGPGEPVRLVSGRSEQDLYWDVNRGRPVSKSEEFEFLMMMSNGVIQEFRGYGNVRYRYSQILDREGVTGSIRRSLETSSGTSPLITVNPVNEGILLSLEDGDTVFFEPESADISTDQLSRLESLKMLLQEFPGRDILITGHTAHFGTPEGRKKLSEDRAAAVASILFPGGRPGPGKLYIRGAGSDDPVSPGHSETGRAANRRVEILILD